MGDVRMIQRGENFSLALEPGEAIGIVNEQVGQNLQGDIAIQLRIAGSVDLTHTAFADQGGDFIRTEARARSQSQENGEIIRAAPYGRRGHSNAAFENEHYGLRHGKT
jgi:hypothetical protein